MTSIHEQRPEQAALAAGGLRVTGGTRPMPCAPRRRLAGHCPVPRRTLNQPIVLEGACGPRLGCAFEGALDVPGLPAASN